MDAGGPIPEPTPPAAAPAAAPASLLAPQKGLEYQQKGSSDSWGLQQLHALNYFKSSNSPKYSPLFISNTGEFIVQPLREMKGLVGVGIEVFLDIFRKALEDQIESCKIIMIDKSNYEPNSYGARDIVPDSALPMPYNKFNDLCLMQDRLTMIKARDTISAKDTAVPFPGLYYNTAFGKKIHNYAKWVTHMRNWVDIYTWIASRFSNMISGVRYPSAMQALVGQFLLMEDYRATYGRHIYLVCHSETYTRMCLATYMAEVGRQADSPESFTDATYSKLLRQMGYGIELSTIGETVASMVSGSVAMGVKLFAMAPVCGLFKVSFGCLGLQKLSLDQLWHILIAVSIVPLQLWDRNEWAVCVHFLRIYLNLAQVQIALPSLCIIDDQSFYRSNVTYARSDEFDLPLPLLPRCAIYGSYVRGGVVIERNQLPGLAGPTNGRVYYNDCPISAADVLSYNLNVLLTRLNKSEATMPIRLSAFSRASRANIKAAIPVMLDQLGSFMNAVNKINSSIMAASFANVLWPRPTAGDLGALNTKIETTYVVKNPMLDDLAKLYNDVAGLSGSIREFYNPADVKTIPALTIDPYGYNDPEFEFNTSDDSEDLIKGLVFWSTSKDPRLLVEFQLNSVSVMLSTNASQYSDIKLPSASSILLRYNLFQQLNLAARYFSLAYRAYNIPSCDSLGNYAPVQYAKRPAWRKFGWELSSINEYKSVTLNEDIYTAYTSGVPGEDFTVIGLKYTMVVDDPYNTDEFILRCGYIPVVQWMNGSQLYLKDLSAYPLMYDPKKRITNVCQSNDQIAKVIQQANRAQAEVLSRLKPPLQLKDKELVSYLVPYAEEWIPYTGFQWQQPFRFDSSGFALIADEFKIIRDIDSMTSWGTTSNASFNTPPIVSAIIDPSIEDKVIIAPADLLSAKPVFLSIKEINPIPDLTFVTVV